MKETARKQCRVVDLQERQNGIMEAYFRFNYEDDEDVLPTDSKLQYRVDTWVTWRFNPAKESSWLLPLVIVCWKTESPITCVFDPSTGSIIGLSLTCVPINKSDEQ